MEKNKKFDYGNYLIEYRNDNGSPLRFLREKVMDIDTAMRKANKLKDSGYYDVTIRQNER